MNWCWFLRRDLGSEPSLTQTLPDGVGDGGFRPELLHGVPKMLPSQANHPGVSIVARQRRITESQVVRLTGVITSPSTTVMYSSDSGDSQTTVEAVTMSFIYPSIHSFRLP